MTYYRADLARVHHEGFANHAENCAPGILALLKPVRQRRGLVVEIGCGSGLLTRRLIDAGHRVLATDSSPAMLALARQNVPDAVDVRPLTLPDDPIPEADAVVGTGHALSYLPDADAVRRGLRRAAGALRPGGVLAVDICDVAWGHARRDAAPFGRVGDGWAILVRASAPTPDTYVREITTFVREADGRYRRDDERHDNVLVDSALIPGWLNDPALPGVGQVDVVVGTSFGGEVLPVGLLTVIARRA